MTQTITLNCACCGGIGGNCICLCTFSEGGATFTISGMNPPDDNYNGTYWLTYNNLGPGCTPPSTLPYPYLTLSCCHYSGGNTNLAQATLDLVGAFWILKIGPATYSIPASAIANCIGSDTFGFQGSTDSGNWPATITVQIIGTCPGIAEDSTGHRRIGTTNTINGCWGICGCCEAVSGSYTLNLSGFGGTWVGGNFGCLNGGYPMNHVPPVSGTIGNCLWQSAPPTPLSGLYLCAGLRWQFKFSITPDSAFGYSGAIGAIGAAALITGFDPVHGNVVMQAGFGQQTGLFNCASGPLPFPQGASGFPNTAVIGSASIG